MSIVDFLYKNAIEHIWSNPKADKNAIFKTNKLTTTAGAVIKVFLPFGNIDLPNTGRRYVLVELGEVPANLVGLETPIYGWVSLSGFIDIYQTMIWGFSRGRMVSLYGSYIQITENGNILLAIDYVYNRNLIAFEDDIYVRFYTNLFYAGNAPTPTQRLTTGSFIYNNLTDYLVFSNTVAGIASSVGVQPLIYKNGIWLPDGLPASDALSVGDIVEYVSDPFILAVNSFVLADLDGYHSTLDNANKVVVSVEQLDDDIYVDDTECYITGVTPSGQRVGAYFPRLSPAVIRGLTFKDLSLNSLMLDARLFELEAYPDINATLSNAKVYVIRKDNQQYKPLLMDSNYIPDLMNLPTAYRKQALIGVNATMPIWLADNLERCPFNTWFGLLPRQVTLSALPNVYSRWGALTYYERVRQLPGNMGWSLPAIAGSGGGVLLSYGADGIGITLTDYSAQDHTNEVYPNGYGYEMFYPQQDNTSPLDIVIPISDVNPTVVPSEFGIFCYYKEATSGELVFARLDVDYLLTDQGDTTTITWIPALQAHERYVRLSNRSVMFTKTITVTDIVAGIDIYDGRAKTNEIGMGVLSMWYNGRYLVEGLDYVVYQAKAFLTAKTQYWTDTAKLDVIYAGLPHPSLQHVPQTNWGWIKHGKLLNDNKYDLLMYRNRLFYVDGRCIPITDFRFEEGYTDIVNTSNGLPFIDGTPYAVVETVHFSRDDLLDQLTPIQAAEDIQDATLRDYLTLLDPQHPNTDLVVITNFYRLISTFTDKLIAEIESSQLIISAPSYTDDEIVAMVGPYMDYYRIDPCLLDIDPNFATIAPMWSDTGATVTLDQFNFLTRVNQLMLNGRVAGLNLYLTITP